MSGYFGVPAAAYSAQPQSAYTTPVTPGMMPTNMPTGVPTGVPAVVPTGVPTGVPAGVSAVVPAYPPASGMLTASPYAAAPVPYATAGLPPPQYQQAAQPSMPASAYAMPAPAGPIYPAPQALAPLPAPPPPHHHHHHQQQQQAAIQTGWSTAAGIVAPAYNQPTAGHNYNQPYNQSTPSYGAVEIAPPQPPPPPPNRSPHQPRQKPVTSRLGVTGVNLSNLKPLASLPEEQPKQQQQQPKQQQHVQQRQQQQQYRPQFQQRQLQQQQSQPRLPVAGRIVSGIRPGTGGVRQQLQQKPQQLQQKQPQQQPFKRAGFPPRPFNNAAGGPRGRQPFRPGTRPPFSNAQQQQQQQQQGRTQQQQQPGVNDGDELVDAPPIGYEYIEELQVPDNQNHHRGGLNRFTIQYRCKLCDCRFTDPQAKEMHVKGRRHRLQFKKKVDPNLEVDLKPSAKARRVQEEKLRPQAKSELAAKRQADTSVPEMHAMEMSNYTGYRAIAGGPSQSPGRQRIESNDDRHAMAKHSSIYPTEEELRRVQSLVSRCERALKLVSDALTENEKDDNADEEKEEEEAADEDNNDSGSGCVLKGVMRVGVLAKGLLLHGDLATNLVLLCSETPTESLLRRVYALMPARLNAEATDNNGDKEEDKVEEDMDKDVEKVEKRSEDGEKDKEEDMEAKNEKDMEEDRDESDKMDKDISDKKDKDESDKTDKDESDKMDNDESDKMDKDESDKTDKDKSDKTDKEISDNMDKEISDKTDKDESDKTDKDESDKMDEDESDKKEKDESDKKEKDESDKKEKDESDKKEKDESDKMDKDISDNMDKDEIDKKDKDKSETMDKDKDESDKKKKDDEKPLLIKLDEEEGAIIVECPISQATCTVTLTSPVVREPQAVDKPEPVDALDKEKCLEALASVRHAKWFQAKASCMSTCVIVTRLLRDLCQRVPTWAPFPEWAMELIVERCASSCRSEFPSPADCIRRVFECLASGLVLPGGPGVRDPCEKAPTDACGTLTAQEREDITASAQHALRLIAFRQLHKVLDIDQLPTPSRHQTTAVAAAAAAAAAAGVKRKAQEADSSDGDCVKLAKT